MKKRPGLAQLKKLVEPAAQISAILSEIGCLIQAPSEEIAGVGQLPMGKIFHS